ncbi:ImmA/IrrE family metallo-endopeptidase [Streptomyces sp. NPDC001889]
MRPTRGSCRTYVRSLDLPAVASIRDLVPEIEKRSGRAVQLLPAELGSTAPCGMYVATEDTNYVFYDPRTSLAHQDHIIAHELAHILRDHRGGAELPQGSTGGLITLMDPDVVRMVLGRTDYAENDEVEAELVGSYLQAHVHSARPRKMRKSREMDVDRIARTLLRSKR